MEVPEVRRREHGLLVGHGGEASEPGINGAIQARTQLPQSVITTIMVASIDDIIRKIIDNGGQIVVPKMDIPKIGVLVYFQDTEGNIFGAMQADPNARMMG